MITSLTYIWIGILTAWTVFALAIWWLAPGLAAPIGLFAGLAAGWLFRASLIMRGFVALLDPIGVVLPLLAVRHMAIAFGYDVVSFSYVELTLFLIGYIGFLAASQGAFGFDAYRFGYKPWPVALIALGLCGLGMVTGNLFYPLVAVTGQAMWTLRLGSSNYFDHILHALLVPVVAIELISRLF